MKAAIHHPGFNPIEIASRKIKVAVGEFTLYESDLFENKTFPLKLLIPVSFHVSSSFRRYFEFFFLYGPRGPKVGSGNSAAISSTDQTWLETPDSIAGVQRSVL
jgi:hypothetical protein